MPYQSFKELNVWQDSRDLAVSIYKLTVDGPIAKDFGLRDQIRRAAVSVPSNISEGYERTTDKEFLHFLDIASGSLSELRTQIDIAAQIGYFDKEQFNFHEEQCQKIGRMLTNLKKARRANMQSQSSILLPKTHSPKTHSPMTRFLKIDLPVSIFLFCIPLLMIGGRQAGLWLLVNDPLPEKLDLIFVFAGADDRYSHALELHKQFPGAHLLVHTMDTTSFTRRFLNGEEKGTNISFLERSKNTLDEVRNLKAWLTSNSHFSNKKLSIGMVSSPYHMRRIKRLSKGIIKNRDYKVSFHPVPMEKTKQTKEQYAHWWKEKGVREFVKSELYKYLLTEVVFLVPGKK